MRSTHEAVAEIVARASPAIGGDELGDALLQGRIGQPPGRSRSLPKSTR
jgi:hypothetical protein